LNIADNQTQDAYIYQKQSLIKDKMQCRKLTFTGPGRKVLPTENVSDQLDYFLDLTLNTPRPTRLDKISIVSSVT
jgi:hypothetical protein